jgi:hypothetical protein
MYPITSDNRGIEPVPSSFSHTGGEPDKPAKTAWSGLSEKSGAALLSNLSKQIIHVDPTDRALVFDAIQTGMRALPQVMRSGPLRTDRSRSPAA